VGVAVRGRRWGVTVDGTLRGGGAVGGGSWRCGGRCVAAWRWAVRGGVAVGGAVRGGGELWVRAGERVGRGVGGR
ncbi:hypothetical protein AB0C31_30620, partial [Actinoplanes philippinensis]